MIVTEAYLDRLEAHVESLKKSMDDTQAYWRGLIAKKEAMVNNRAAIIENLGVLRQPNTVVIAVEFAKSKKALKTIDADIQAITKLIADIESGIGSQQSQIKKHKETIEEARRLFSCYGSKKNE